jgi:Lon protease-like protein
VDVPLFPLHTVLTPGLVMPLHIFEPRYRLMTERCLADRSPFGVVLIREEREAAQTATRLARVGTLAEIRQAVRFEDGRHALLIEGSRRFVVEGVKTVSEPYLVGEVRLLPETVGDEDAARSAARRVLDRFLEYVVVYQTLAAQRRQAAGQATETQPSSPSTVVAIPGERRGGGSSRTDPPPGLDWQEHLVQSIRRLTSPDDPVAVSHLVGGLLQVDLSDRQALLEEVTAQARLTRLEGLLDRELELLGRGLPPYVVDGRPSPLRLN